jgi:hypothetical protein
MNKGANAFVNSLGAFRLIRFSTRSLVLWLTLLLVSLGFAFYFLLRPGPNDRQQRLEPLIQIKTRSDWESALQNKHCVVFVDGLWNTDTARFRGPFERFAAWQMVHSDVRVFTMMINPDDTSDDVWRICEELWRKNDISPGGLKNLGGAGRVLWINNGKVVDYAWCMELMNHDDTDNTEMVLKTRTTKAFD